MRDTMLFNYPDPQCRDGRVVTCDHDLIFAASILRPQFYGLDVRGLSGSLAEFEIRLERYD